MRLKRTLILAAMAAGLLLPQMAEATKFVELRIVDKDYLMVHFKDGEVIYREDVSRPDAYIGHESEAVYSRYPDMPRHIDTLLVYGAPLEVNLAADASLWRVKSQDDPSFTEGSAVQAWRKSKPFGVTNAKDGLRSKPDHWIFLKMPQPMRQGCSYVVEFPEGLGADVTSAQICYDIWNSPSESIHVNIVGYSPREKTMGADLYLWLGDGGERDYCSFEGKKVYLYDVAAGSAQEAGEVKFWKARSESALEQTGEDLTGSDVWNIDFRAPAPGRYRLVVEDVGCSMDFDVDEKIYYEPYRYALRGYYYMRVGEPIDPNVSPVPRQPRFIPGVDPAGLKIYLTDLQPWHPEWRKMGGDTWDEPHFKSPESSGFWAHRLPGNPTNELAVGGHSDAYDWDRHLAHVSNIYDHLLPYFLTDGRLGEDNLGIRESGNGIPDILDEVRNEVDFFLSIRTPDGGYSQGVTNPSDDWTVMFQAGATAIAAWANAANAAMLSDAFRIQSCDSLRQYYADKAIEAFRYAESLKKQMLDESQFLGDVSMRGRDFRQMAAAFLYNSTGDRKWERILAKESIVRNGKTPLYVKGSFFRQNGQTSYCQLWGTLAYLLCPRERHYPTLYADMLSSVQAQAEDEHISKSSQRPSRRASNGSGNITNQSVQLVLIAHALSDDEAVKADLEKGLYLEAGWGLGRNPSNTVEMTGLGQRHFTDIYSTGHNDGVPGTHPGQTPFSGIGTWSRGDGGDASILLNRLYPAWSEGNWPREETFFNQRYMWSNAEFTPRETMRGKFALLAYLYGIRK